MDDRLTEAILDADKALMEALQKTEALVDVAIQLRLEAMEQHKERLNEAKHQLDKVEQEKKDD